MPINPHQTIVNCTELPVNVMCVPGLPHFDELQAMGVKRISMGDFVHEAMLASLSSILTSIKTKKAFHPLFE